MNIAIISNFNFDGTTGGAAKATRDLALALSKNNKVLFIFPEETFQQTVVNSNLTLLTVPSFGPFDSKTYTWNSRANKFFLNQIELFNPSIIHTQSENLHAQLLQRYAIKKRIPFLITLHVMPTQIKNFVNQEDKGKYVYSSILFRNLQLSFYKMCTAVVTLNSEAEKDLRLLGYKNKIFVIPNTIDLTRFSVTKEEIIKRNKKDLIYVGHINKRKNQKFLLEVLKELGEDYKLTLIGNDLEPNYSKEVHDYATNNKLSVNFISNVPNDKVIKLLEMSGVFVSASTLEVQSLSIMEALASKLPIVALSNQTTREYLVNDLSQLVEEDNIKFFAEKVKAISNLDSNRYYSLCEDNYNKVQKNDERVILEKTQEMYDELISTNLLIPNSFDSSFYYYLNAIGSNLISKFQKGRL